MVSVSGSDRSVPLHGAFASSSERSADPRSDALRSTVQELPLALAGLRATTESETAKTESETAKTESETSNVAFQGHGGLLLRPASPSAFPIVPMRLNHQEPGRFVSLISTRASDTTTPVCAITHEVRSHNIPNDDESQARSGSEHNFSAPTQIDGGPAIDARDVLTKGWILDGEFRKVYAIKQPLDDLDGSAIDTINGAGQLSNITSVSERDLLVASTVHFDLLDVESHEPGKTVLTNRLKRSYLGSDEERRRITLSKLERGGYEILEERKPNEGSAFREVNRTQLDSGRSTPKFRELVFGTNQGKWNVHSAKAVVREGQRLKVEALWAEDAKERRTIADNEWPPEMVVQEFPLGMEAEDFGRDHWAEMSLDSEDIARLLGVAGVEMQEGPESHSGERFITGSDDALSDSRGGPLGPSSGFDEADDLKTEALARQQEAEWREADEELAAAGSPVAGSE